jgi:hypothetical protein
MAKTRTLSRAFLTLTVLAGLGGDGLILASPSFAKPMASQATTASNRPTTPRPPVFRGAFRPAGSGMPEDNTAGGASRSSGRCPQDRLGDDASVTLITPDSKGGLTVAARPTLLAHIHRSNAKRLFFSVRDDRGNYHYQTMMTMPKEEGIVAFSLPKNAPELEPNKMYHWSVVLVCTARLRPDSPRVEGWIQRQQTAPSASVPSLEQAVSYYNAGLWYDALGTMADLRQKYQGDRQYEQAWGELMQTVGLNRLAQAPLLP